MKMFVCFIFSLFLFVAVVATLTSPIIFFQAGVPWLSLLVFPVFGALGAAFMWLLDWSAI